MVKLLSSGALLASLCRAAAAANSPCLVTTVSQQQSCPALLVVRMVHSKCRGETYKYGKDEVKRTKCLKDILNPHCGPFLPFLVFFPFLSSCTIPLHVFFFSSSSSFLPLLVFFLVTTVHNPGCKAASPRGKSPLVSGMA